LLTGRRAATRGSRVVIVDGVATPEDKPHAAAVRQSLRRTNLVRVGVEHDIGLAVCAGRKEPAGHGRRVDDLVGTGLTARETDHFSDLQTARSGGRSQLESALEDDHHLLLGEMEVVRVRRLAGIDLP
jgi:hypothetical protein